MTVLQKAERYVFQQYKDTLSKQYTYHNFNHTLGVINALKELILAESLDEEQAEVILLAGWFHDLGYLKNCKDHETHSSAIAQIFLADNGYPEEKIKEVVRLIQSTNLKHEPTDLLESCIKDADFAHFADKNYQDISLLLKKEVEMNCNSSLTDLEWQCRNRDIMQNHHRYYTEYAQKKWHPEKVKNLLKVLQQIEKLENTATISKKQLNKKKLEKLDRPERGIDTLFRVALRNHTQLSSIADSKANILLSVNAIIISISLSALIPKLDSPSNAHLIYPTFTLLLSSVASIIFAILSTRPKVTSGTFTSSDITSRKINLLFFGNFHQMPLDEYTKALHEVIQDREYLYDSLIKDLYSLGLVLNRKYRLLRITYSIFMVGIIVSVLAFIAAFKGTGL